MEPSTSFYPQFKASVQQRKSLLYLKPYVKSSFSFDAENACIMLSSIEHLKSQLYKGINECQNLYSSYEGETLYSERPAPSNRTVIQYLTQYQGDRGQDEPDNTVSRSSHANTWSAQGGKSKGDKSRNLPIAVLREKLRNKYKDSKYSRRMSQMAQVKNAVEILETKISPLCPLGQHQGMLGG